MSEKNLRRYSHVGAWFVRARVSLAMLGIELKTRSVKNLLFFEPTARRKTLPFLRRGVGLGPLDALLNEKVLPQDPCSNINVAISGGGR